MNHLSENPKSIFPDWLVERWSSVSYLDGLAKNFKNRRSSGTSVFDSDLSLQQMEWSSDLFVNSKRQAMDQGSFKFCQWVSSKLNERDEHFIDLCAAPGGKSIYINQFLLNQGKKPEPVLCEKKLNRLRQLQENWIRWGFSASEKTFLMHEWGNDQIPTQVKSSAWDFALCDLPCSGSGTLNTRPDVLLHNWDTSLQTLIPTQQKIIRELKSLKIKKYFVSVCSTDQQEIDAISKELACEPTFYSWQNESDFSSEGLVGWYCTS